MTDTTTAAAAATTTTTTTAADTQVSTTPAAGAGFDWSQHGIAGEDLGFVQNKGFKGPGDLLGSYRNLEKLRGVPPERLLTIPGDDSPEAWGAVYERLGRPKEASAYELPVPDGVDGKFADTAKSWFHEAGLSAKQAKAITEKWNAHMAGANTEAQKATTERHAAEVTALKTEWGGEYDKRAQLVDKAAETFGMTQGHLDALKTAMGPKAAMQFLHTLGTKLGVSDTMVTGQAATGFSMTPEQARAEIATLIKDKGHGAKLAAGDADARARWERLHRLAYPDPR